MFTLSEIVSVHQEDPEPGSGAYKKRRLLHWFEKSMGGPTRETKTFDAWDDCTKEQVTNSLLPDDRSYAIFLHKNETHWCLLTDQLLYWHDKEGLHVVQVDAIQSFDWSWGDLTDLQKTDLENRIKLSPWLSITLKSGEIYTLRITGRGNALFENAIRKLQLWNSIY